MYKSTIRKDNYIEFIMMIDGSFFIELCTRDRLILGKTIWPSKVVPDQIQDGIGSLKQLL